MTTNQNPTPPTPPAGLDAGTLQALIAQAIAAATAAAPPSEMAAVSRALQEQTAALSGVRTAMADLTTQVSSARSSLDTLNTQVTGLGTQLTSIAARVSTLENATANLHLQAHKQFVAMSEKEKEEARDKLAETLSHGESDLQKTVNSIGSRWYIQGPVAIGAGYGIYRIGKAAVGLITGNPAMAVA